MSYRQIGTKGYIILKFISARIVKSLCANCLKFYFVAEIIC